MGAVIAALGVVIATATRRHRLPAWLRLLLAAALVGYVMASSHFNLGRDTACALLAAMLAIKPVELASVRDARSEEHTSELQSLMRISYAVFCLKKKNRKKVHTTDNV